VEMDGFEPSQDVIVLAATNRPDVLDPALLRPGRFDRRIEVGLPDREGRLAILRLHGARVPLAPDIDLESIARRTAGLSGADLANLVNEAALAAGRQERQQVTQADLEEAFEKVLLGARRKFALSEEDKRRVAVHEAGHALVAHLVPEADPLEKVTLVPRGRALGVTQFTPLDDRQNLPESYVRAQLAVALGGRAAEQVVLGEVSSGAENDLEAATSFARRMVERWGMGRELGPVSITRDSELPSPLVQFSSELSAQADRELVRILREAEDLARSVLTEHRPALEALAGALVERETVDRQQVEEIVRERQPAG
jgi:cell division protease FtsH